MKTATALLVRTIAEPPTSSVHSSPEQWVLPLVPMPRLAQRELARPSPIRAKASIFVQALVEVMAGDRPATQMAAWMSADVYDQLVQRLSIHARSPQLQHSRAAARVGSVHVAMIGDDSAEIAARMVQSGRSRALAIRLELQQELRGGQQWRCTALTWG